MCVRDGNLSHFDNKTFVILCYYYANYYLCIILVVELTMIWALLFTFLCPQNQNGVKFSVNLVYNNEKVSCSDFD